MPSVSLSPYFLFTGGLIIKPLLVSSPSYTLKTTDFVIDYIGGEDGSLLFPVSPSEGQCYSIGNRTIYSLTIQGNGHTINGENQTQIISQYDTFFFVFNKTEWTIR